MCVECDRKDEEIRRLENVIQNRDRRISDLIEVIEDDDERLIDVRENVKVVVGDLRRMERALSDTMRNIRFLESPRQRSGIHSVWYEREKGA